MGTLWQKASTETGAFTRMKFILKSSTKLLKKHSAKSLPSSNLNQIDKLWVKLTFWKKKDFITSRPSTRGSSQWMFAWMKSKSLGSSKSTKSILSPSSTVGTAVLSTPNAQSFPSTAVLDKSKLNRLPCSKLTTSTINNTLKNKFRQASTNLLVRPTFEANIKYRHKKSPKDLISGTKIFLLSILSRHEISTMLFPSKRFLLKITRSLAF